MDEKAIVCAKKLCGIGECVAGFKCSHKNHKGCLVPPVEGSSDVCPLEKYNIVPEEDEIPWYKRPRSEIEPSKKELKAICEECEYKITENIKDEDIWQKNMATCFSCPVKVYKEQLLETEAEVS